MSDSVLSPFPKQKPADTETIVSAGFLHHFQVIRLGLAAMLRYVVGVGVWELGVYGLGKQFLFCYTLFIIYAILRHIGNSL